MRINHILDKLNSSIKESLDDKRLSQKEYAKRIQVVKAPFPIMSQA